MTSLFFEYSILKVLGPLKNCPPQIKCVTPQFLCIYNNRIKLRLSLVWDVFFSVAITDINWFLKNIVGMSEENQDTQVKFMKISQNQLLYMAAEGGHLMGSSDQSAECGMCTHKTFSEACLMHTKT